MRIPLILFIISIIISSCQSVDYSPKPRGFHRIVFPEKEYITSNIPGCPFYFEIPSYSKLSDDESNNAGSCWKNLDFPQFNARLHLSYSKITVTSPIEQLAEDARTFAFKHTSKATSIDQKKIYDAANKVFGLEYNISGNTASNYQFYVTDSSINYVRGALYFYEKPHLDSIQPVLEFLKSDVQHLIKSVRWK